MDRRSFFVNAAKAAAVISTASFFDMGAAWQRHASGLFFRKGDIIELTGVFVTHPQTGRTIDGHLQKFMVIADYHDSPHSVEGEIQLSPVPLTPSFWKDLASQYKAGMMIPGRTDWLGDG
jgi:hypothetical protein